jgi:EF hand
MTRTGIFWLAALAATTAALGVHAQDIQTPAAAAAPGPAAQVEIDRNRDGKITKAEAARDAELARRFSTLDIDNSGKLDSGEFARFEAEAEPVEGERVPSY